MDIKVVYDPQKGLTAFYEELHRMIDHLELQDRLVTIYLPDYYKMNEQPYRHVDNAEWYQRIVEYERK